MPGIGKMLPLKQMTVSTFIGQTPTEEEDGGLENLEDTNPIKTTQSKHKK